jgi:outer membrane murein-binding lipoprotein Lpp
MAQRILAVLLIVTVLCGCESEDKGTPPPPAKPLTQDQINAMPPEARAAMESAQRQGNATAEQLGKEKASGQ